MDRQKLIDNFGTREFGLGLGLWGACLTAAGALGVGFVGDARAQEQDTDGLEQITVTARRFSEDIQETAGSVSAFTATTLDDLRITQANDLQNLAANLTLKRRGAQRPAA